MLVDDVLRTVLLVKVIKLCSSVSYVYFWLYILVPSLNFCPNAVFLPGLCPIVQMIFFMEFFYVWTGFGLDGSHAGIL